MVPLVVIQYMSDQLDFINCYVGGSNIGVATTGFNNRVRATGTFSYITGLSIGSLLGEAAGIYLYMTSPRQGGRVWAMLAIIASVICGFATVSRGSLIASTLLLIAWAWYSRGSRPKFVAVGCLGAMAAVAYFEQGSVGQVISAVFTRSQAVEDSYLGRLWSLVFDLTSQSAKTPFGGGLGISQNVAGGFYNAGVETEMGRLVFELGLIGFTGFVLTYWGAVYWLVRNSLAATDFRVKSLGFSCSVTCALLLLAGVIFNHIALAAFWATFSAGAFLVDNQRA